MDIREHKLKKALRGYDMEEVDSLKHMAADALAELTGENAKLSDEIHELKKKLTVRIKREEAVKKAISTAQKMAEGLKVSAEKEAELIVGKAELDAEALAGQSVRRVDELRSEIMGLKKQRMELEKSIRASIDYHTGLLDLTSEESRKSDEELEKLKFLRRK